MKKPANLNKPKAKPEADKAANIPAHLLEAAQEDAQLTTSNKHVDAVRQAADEARQLELEIANLEERLSEKNESLQKLYYEKLPDLMEQAGVLKLTLDAKGNAPACNIEVKPYYRANIGGDWDDARKKAAFAHLDAMGAGPIIKTVVAVAFDKSERKAALELVKKLQKDKKLKQAVQITESVHHMTLTAWLKEEWPKRQMAGKKLPDLEKIGGTVGRVAALKPVKESGMTTRQDRKSAARRG